MPIPSQPISLYHYNYIMQLFWFLQFSKVNGKNHIHSTSAVDKVSTGQCLAIMLIIFPCSIYSQHAAVHQQHIKYSLRAILKNIISSR